MSRHLLTWAVLVTAVTFQGPVAHGHPADEDSDLTLPQTTQEFRQDRFGMMLNWGVHSMLGDGEMVMENRDLTVAEYERLASFFNPSDYNITDWVALAKTAGMQYVTFTFKGPDGLAMWDSASSNWNIVRRTPLARDVVGDLVDECGRHHLQLFARYSPFDWHYRETYRAADSDAAADAMTTAAVERTYTQISEFMKRYAPIRGVWLDGWWDGPEADQELQRTYALIRQLQPAALIGANRSGDTSSGEDFQIHRGALPADQIPGEDNTLNYSTQPHEIYVTLNQSVGFKLDDRVQVSARDIVHALVRAAGVDANLLLQVNVMPNGQIQPEVTESLQRVGMWMAKHGETIYSTRGGPSLPEPWGVTTHRRHRIYVHVLDPEVRSIELHVPHELRTALYFSDESEIPFEQDNGTVRIENLREEYSNEYERVLILETARYRED